MPLLALHTSAALDDATASSLLAELSRLVAATIGKPEAYVMTRLARGPMTMGGTPAPAAHVDVRSIGGLTPAVNRALSRQLGELLQARLGLDPARVFLTFAEVDPAYWGHDGSTFG